MPNTSTNPYPSALLRKSFLLLGLVSGQGSETMATVPSSFKGIYNACKSDSDDTRTHVIINNNIIFDDKIIASKLGLSTKSKVDKKVRHVLENSLNKHVEGSISNEKVKSLFEKFNVEHKLFPDLIKIDFETAVYKFLHISSIISKLIYNEAYVQLKNDNAFKFNLYFDGEIELMLTFCFDANDELKDNEMFYSVFKQDEVISVGIYEIDRFVEAFPKYL